MRARPHGRSCARVRLGAGVGVGACIGCVWWGCCRCVRARAPALRFCVRARVRPRCDFACARASAYAEANRCCEHSKPASNLETVKGGCPTIPVDGVEEERILSPSKPQPTPERRRGLLGSRMRSPQRGEGGASVLACLMAQARRSRGKLDKRSKANHPLQAQPFG